MSYYEYCFTAPVETLPIGVKKVLSYDVIILPETYISALPFDQYPKLRIIGEVAERPVRGAWNPVGDGRKYFILSAKFLKDAGLQLGDMAEMRFNIDDQDHVDVPEELLDRLSHDAALSEIWTALTSGKKRFYCHQISSAKQQATRDRRLQSVIEQLGAL